jgi:hypothetical protein
MKHSVELADVLALEGRMSCITAMWTAAVLAAAVCAWFG